MTSAPSGNSKLVDSPPSPHTAKTLRLSPMLYLLFFFSGCSGLLYELVWLRMLGRTLGNTVYATSVILAVFMAGLALGSFVFGRWADKVRRLALLYGCLEAGVGLTALLSLGLNSWPVPLYRAIYAMAGDSRLALTIGQVALVTLALLIPTSMMGATLPTLCAYGVRKVGSIGHIAGVLYALNTLGALAGVVAGGFILIGAIGETNTVLVGVAVNWLVAIIALALLPAGASSAALPSTPVFEISSLHRPLSDRARSTVLICFAVSGFVSLGMEIIWSRMLVLYAGTSIYAFSAMLAAMLAGIGIGGRIGARVERWKDPLLALARLELGAALAIAFGLVAFRYVGYGRFLPAIVVVGPTALFLGIAFPVAVRCYADKAQAIGRRVGELYAWNTIGCILGALAGGFILVPIFGAANSGAILGALMMVSSIALLAVHPAGLNPNRLLEATVAIATAVILVANGDPYRDVIFSRFKPGWEVFAHVDEAAATTTAAGIPANRMSRQLLVNGYGMTILITGNKLMAHLPIWFSDSPRRALVICMGMGTTFRSAARHSDIDVTAVELVPAVPRFMHFFHPDADRVLAQPNAHVVVDDGRNYLLMHQQPFDVITLDPPPPLDGAGTVNLYSKEFFELCAKRLRPGGAMCLWVQPAAESDSKMILRTYATVFPYVSVWTGPTFNGFLLIGTLRPVNDVAARVRRGLTDPATLADLTEWDDTCRTPEKILSLWICNRAQLLDFCGGSPLVTDDHPYTEFPIWRMAGWDPDYSKHLNSVELRSWLNSRGKK